MFDSDYTPVSRSFRRITGTFLLAAGALAAQSTADWNVVKSLASGTQVRIVAASQTTTGRLQSASDESVVLNLEKGQETFTRRQVAQVAVRKDGKRPRNTWIGLAAGAGLGLIAGAITDSKCAGFSCFLSPNFGKAVLPPAGAILGLGVGWGWPTGGWRNVYKQQ